MDWVYGDNLASGHFLAAKGLAEKPEQVGGQVPFLFRSLFTSFSQQLESD